MQKLIITSEDELKLIIIQAVKEVMPREFQNTPPESPIKGIHALAKFLNVSPARAQKLKNENKFPYWQDGRTLLFNPQLIREIMGGKNFHK